MFGNKKKGAPKEMEEPLYYRQDTYHGENYQRRSRYSTEGRYASEERFEDVPRSHSRRIAAEEDRYSARRAAPTGGRDYSSGRRDTRRYDEQGRYRSGYNEKGRPIANERAYYAPRRKKRHTGRNVLIGILLVLFAMVLGAWGFLGRIDRGKISNLITNSGITASGYQTIVLYGVDSRHGDMTIDTHSDTIMICSINKRSGEIKLVSVYRDTYLDNTNGEYRKATECYYFGGPERSINMLNKNLDLNITDYITVDFGAVIKVIDALDGIDLEITDEEMNLINGYCVENKEVTGVDYEPLYSSGYVHLTGIQALAYCRIRYTEGWDYKRTERQRTVMNLCYQKAQQKGVTAMLSIANSMMSNISTSMGNMELLGLVGGMLRYRLGEQSGFPFDKAAADVSGAGDVVVPVTLTSNVSALHEFLYGVSSYTPSETVQQISNTISANTGYY